MRQKTDTRLSGCGRDNRDSDVEVSNRSEFANEVNDGSLNSTPWICSDTTPSEAPTGWGKDKAANHDDMPDIPSVDIEGQDSSASKQGKFALLCFR